MYVSTTTKVKQQLTSELLPRSPHKKVIVNIFLLEDIFGCCPSKYIFYSTLGPKLKLFERVLPPDMIGSPCKDPVQVQYYKNM